MPISDKGNLIFGLLFLLTGIFAIVGGLFTWGSGWLFWETNPAVMLIPMADLLIAGPMSILTGIGLTKKQSWSIGLGLMTSGVYIFGSAEVYILIWLNEFPADLKFLVPPIFGLAIAFGFLVWTIRKKYSFNDDEN